jgi:Flp pilus assembly protein TadG
MTGKLAKYLQRRVEDIFRLSGARGGATAVEFALLAPVFIAVLVALFQTTVFLFAQAALQDAAVQAARYFMTGQAQNGSWTATNIQQKVCTSTALSLIFDCNKLIVVVQTYSDFASASTTAPQLYNNGQPVTTFTYSPGTPGDVMVVQLVYPWSVVSAPLGFALANLPNGAAEMVGVSAFRVEPY